MTHYLNIESTREHFDYFEDKAKELSQLKKYAESNLMDKTKRQHNELSERYSRPNVSWNLILASRGDGLWQGVGGGAGTVLECNDLRASGDSVVDYS